uniref:Uncharacterized protein n=1 Tax=Trypanosoma congolense (strain IL3000) TaxID=1068625 RepID=G0UU10_TRYCI|nr:hypothetical protein TCIL3000_9_2710 [Trypanosoma congolense IL3000]
MWHPLSPGMGQVQCPKNMSLVKGQQVSEQGNENGRKPAKYAKQGANHPGLAKGKIQTSTNRRHDKRRTTGVLYSKSRRSLMQDACGRRGGHPRHGNQRHQEDSPTRWQSPLEVDGPCVKRWSGIFLETRVMWNSRPLRMRRLGSSTRHCVRPGPRQEPEFTDSQRIKQQVEQVYSNVICVGCKVPD